MPFNLKTIFCFLSITICAMPVAQATIYGCVDPGLIQTKKNPETSRVEWSFQFGPTASKWEGMQTEPSKVKEYILKPGSIRAIKLDYGNNGENWPVPRLTCYYLGDGMTSASGYISTVFFNRPTTTPSIDKIDFSTTVYCDAEDPQKCEVEVN